MDNMHDLLQTQCFKVNSMHWVHILHIEDPNLFYVRLTKYWDFVQKIAHINPKRKPIIVGTNQNVIFNLNNRSYSPRYARGRIIKVDRNANEHETTCDIFAIDYGHVKIDVPMEDIWEGGPDLFYLTPGLANSCQLADCVKKGKSWNNGILVLKELACSDKCFRMVVEDRSSVKLSVSLYNEYQEDFATMLALTDCTTLTCERKKVYEVKPSPKRVLYFRGIFAYKDKYIELGTTLRVRVLSGSSLKAFYVADLNDHRSYYQNFINKITKDLINQPKLEENAAKQGTIIAVLQKSQNVYERGIIKEMIDFKRAVVYMVDTGKQECVHIDDMRKMNYKCMDMPMVAIFCGSVDIEMDTNTLLRVGNQLDITLLTRGSGFDKPSIFKISEVET